jgi:hypothetical protein
MWGVEERDYRDVQTDRVIASDEAVRDDVLDVLRDLWEQYCAEGSNS